MAGLYVHVIKTETNNVKMTDPNTICLTYICTHCIMSKLSKLDKEEEEKEEEE